MLRRYIYNDREILDEMLLTEGLLESELPQKGYESYDTFVLDDDGMIKGFFSIKNEWGFPSLEYFCTKREYRSPELARELTRAFTGVIKINGFKKAIVHATKEQIGKYIEYYWKTKPYAYKNDTAWYLVEVK